MTKINSFRGGNHFLSNFSEHEVTYEGITYQNNEAAFQSAKILDKNKRLGFANLKPGWSFTLVGNEFSPRVTNESNSSSS